MLINSIYYKLNKKYHHTNKMLSIKLAAQLNNNYELYKLYSKCLKCIQSQKKNTVLKIKTQEEIFKHKISR